jgi:outer membrane protein
MNQQWYRAAFICFAMVMISSSQAWAANPFMGFMQMVAINTEDIQGVLGLGAKYETEPYIDKGESIDVVPIAVLEYKRFFIDGDVFGYHFSDEKSLRLSVVGHTRLMGYEGDDSSMLNGMEGRRGSLDGGIRLEWNAKHFSMTLTGLTDLMNQHQGQEISAVISKQLCEGMLRPRLGMKWMSDALVDYYYGVMSNELRLDRPAYEAGNTINPFAGVTLAIPVTQQWAVIADFTVESLGSQIQDSPIVDADETWAYVLGAVYRF